MKNLSLLALIVLLISCNSDVEDTFQIEEENNIPSEQLFTGLADTVCFGSVYRKEGKVYSKNDQTYLWAGQDSSWHFNITDWMLNDCNLAYGLGRETFPALLEPEYAKIPDVKIDYDSNEKCLVLYENDKVKVFPYEAMISYEVVNEVNNGDPIMIAYCVLADLGAVYTRNYCGHTLTFAVSGYTYYDSNVWGGLDAFLLWDRDTESLWWPLIDKAVSGDMKGATLRKYNEALWEVITWQEVLERYPESNVLKVGQKQDPPGPWAKPNSTLFECK